MRLGKIVDETLNVFHIETAINNRMYGADMDFLLRNEDDFTAFDRMKFEAMRYTMSKLPRLRVASCCTHARRSTR